MTVLSFLSSQKEPILLAFFFFLKNILASGFVCKSIPDTSLNYTVISHMLLVKLIFLLSEFRKWAFLGSWVFFNIWTAQWLHRYPPFLLLHKVKWYPNLYLQVRSHFFFQLCKFSFTAMYLRWGLIRSLKLYLLEASGHCITIVPFCFKCSHDHLPKVYQP